MPNQEGDVLRKPGRGRMHIQSAGSDFVGPGYRLTVPASIARMVGPEALFAVELVDEGILYRYVDGETNAAGLPMWLRWDRPD